MCGICFAFSCPTVVCIDDDAGDDDDELTLADVFGKDCGIAAATDDDDDDEFVVAFVVVAAGVAVFALDVDDVDGADSIVGGYWKTFGCEAEFGVVIDFGVSFIECCCCCCDA